MEDVCSLLTVCVSLIATLVNTQHMALRHNGSTIDALTYIPPESAFYMECETEIQTGFEALTVALPSGINCVECDKDGTTYVNPDCDGFVNAVCLANTTLLGQIVVTRELQGLYKCTYYTAQNETYVVEGVLVDNATVHGQEYVVMDEGFNFTCSTNLGTPRPSVKWFTTMNGSEIVIEGETNDTEDEYRYYSTIYFTVPDGKLVMDIKCVAQQIVFAVAVTSNTLNIPIHVRADKPHWGNGTGPIYFEPEMPLRLTIWSSLARPTANATWFIHANGQDEPLIGNQSSCEEGEQIWHDIEFIPTEYLHRMNVYCSIDQGPPLYEQNSSSRELLIKIDQTTQDIDTTTEFVSTQETTPELPQDLSVGEIVGIVVGCICGFVLLVIFIFLIIHYCSPAVLESCGLMTCCVKSATLEKVDDNIPID